MDQSLMGEDCDWTLLVPEDLEGRAEEEGGEEIGGLRGGEDEGAPQGEAGEVSHCTYVYCVYVTVYMYVTACECVISANVSVCAM